LPEKASFPCPIDVSFQGGLLIYRFWYIADSVPFLERSIAY
jgi:hypothetical protein